MKIHTALWPWIIAGAVIALAMYSINGIFLPFVSGMFIAYAMHPTVTKMTEWGVGRTLATSLMLLSFFIIIGSMLFVLIPFITVELISIAGSLPQYAQRLFNVVLPYLDAMSSYIGIENMGDIQTRASTYFGDMFSWGLRFIASLLGNTLALANLISLIIITPVVAFYLLRDWPLILSGAKRLLPLQQAPTILDLASQINNTLGAYVRGQSQVCLILAFIYSLGLWLVGLKYSFTIGIVTGLLSFITFVGMLIGVFAGLGVALAQFDTWTPIVLVGGVFTIGSIIEGQLLSPNLVGGRIGLHPVWVIFALLAGGSMLGFIGMLLALPTAAIIGVLVRYSIARYLVSPLYLGDEVKVKKL
jgi:predicted PurR-regulated permease PerM